MPDPGALEADVNARSFLAGLHVHRKSLLGRFLWELRADDRILAVWSGGSLGRGTDDEWSDLDLGCVIRDDDFEDWPESLPGLYQRIGNPLLVGPIRATHGAATGRSQSVLFTGPVSLDIDVLPKSSTTRPVDTQVVFERSPVPILPPPSLHDWERLRQFEQTLGFFWSMVPIALKYAGRAATARAVTQIDLLADTFVRLWRLTYQPDRTVAGGANWLHPTHDAELIRRLPRLGAAIDPVEALDGIQRLMTEVSGLLPALERAGVAIPHAAIHEVDRLSDETRFLLQQRTDRC